MGYSVQDVGKLFKAETNPNLVKFAEASYGYVDGEYQDFQSRYVKFTNELNKVLLNYANNLQDAKKTLEQISQLVKIEQTEVKGLNKTQKIYLTGLTNFIAPIVEQVGKDMKTSSLPSTGGAVEATNKSEKSSPSSDKCALQNFSPNVSLFKGHKQSPFSLDELKKFEANDPKTRANLAADVFKKTHGQDAEKILNAHSLLGTIPTGGVYFMKDNVLYFSLYDKDGNWLRVQKYCAATKSWETSSTRTGSLEVIKQDEESKKSQAPKEKPKGYSSSTIRTLQQLLNAASKILKLKPLEPTRNSKNGVDGIFGEDTRRLVADVRKKDAQAPKNIKKLIKYLQEEYVDFRLPDEEPSSQPEKAQSGLSLPSVGRYGTVRMPELGDSLKESRSKITVNNSLKKKIIKELNSLIKLSELRGSATGGGGIPTGGTASTKTPVADKENLAIVGSAEEEAAIQDILKNRQQVLELEKKYNQGIELTTLQRKALFRYNVNKAGDPGMATVPAPSGTKQDTRFGGYVRCTDPTVIVAAQQYMKYIRKYPIKVDGKYGPETHGMFKVFFGMQPIDPLYKFSGALANSAQMCDILSVIKKSPDKMSKLGAVLAKVGESIGELPKVKKVKKSAAPAEKSGTSSEEDQTDIQRRLFPSVYCDDGTIAPNGDKDKCPTDVSKRFNRPFGEFGTTQPKDSLSLKESKDWLEKAREKSFNSTFRRLTENISKK